MAAFPTRLDVTAKKMRLHEFRAGAGRSQCRRPRGRAIVIALRPCALLPQAAKRKALRG